MGKGSDNKLPSGVIAALPKDPDQQLAVAQQITQYAVSGRVAKLEAETASLRTKVAEKDGVIGSLQTRLVGTETTLAETTAKLALAMEEQAKFIKDKDVLSGQVKQLMCQVSKLDDFKKALVKSLEASSECGPDSPDEKEKPCPPQSPCAPATPEEPASPLPSPVKKEGPFSCMKKELPECPPESPSSADCDAISGAQTPWVDGKEFFQQARNRLTYEQFSEFLTNIKELNAHRQTREETKQKSTEIFGPGNCDLTVKFADLLSRYITPPLPNPLPNPPGDQQPGLSK